MVGTISSTPLMVFWSARKGSRTQQCVFARVANGFVLNVLEDEIVVREHTAATLSELHEMHSTWRTQWIDEGWSVV